MPLSEPISDAGLSPLPSNSACSPTRPVMTGLPSPARNAAASAPASDIFARMREPVGAPAQHDLSAGTAARERALGVLDRDLAGAEPQRAAQLTAGQRRRKRGARGGEAQAAFEIAEQAFAERLARPGRAVGARRPRHSGRDREQRHHVGRVGIDLALDALERRRA